MTVEEMIEWLRTMPLDAKIQTIRHSSGRDYYDHGGNINVIDFISSEASENNNYNQEWELYRDSNGNTTLLLGSHSN